MRRGREGRRWIGGKGKGRTGVVELVAGVAENFEGAAELLGAEGGVQREEDLDHVCGVVVERLGGGRFGDCTHFGGLAAGEIDGLMWVDGVDG